MPQTNAAEPAKKFNRTRLTCFFTYLAMSSVFSLPPILFVTFRETYGISYTLLGTLVLINFSTQLIIDLIFTFFSKHFNIHKTVRIMPLITSTGLAVYAIIPTVFPEFAYAGLVAGTVIFSIAAGLCEVLMSPLVAALPSDTPEKDMSTLHSLYAYGVTAVVIISTLFFLIFGRESWMYLTLFFALLPIISAVLFSVSPLPEMKLSQNAPQSKSKGKYYALALCTACIFLGSAAENSMTNWISGYVENALNMPKAAGDILGLTLFAILLGLGRTLYAKYGKSIFSVLVFGMIGATVCYITAALSPVPVISLIACVLMGLCTSMLWPGTLILMEERIPAVGVAAYALMAAGGDLGASVAPQLLGIIVDTVSASPGAQTLASTFSLTTEQLGMKVGMLGASLFPLAGIFLLIYMRSFFKRQSKLKNEG